MASKAKGEGRQTRWPDVSCPEGSATTARDLLHAVIFIAARGGAPDLGGIIRRVLRCATHGYETNLPPDAHGEHLLRAKMHADARLWDEVKHDLNH